MARTRIGMVVIATVSLGGCGYSSGSPPDVTIGPQSQATVANPQQPNATAVPAVSQPPPHATHTVPATVAPTDLVPAPGPGTPVPGGVRNIGHFAGQYFVAWLPKDWMVTNESANGIDIASPKRDGAVAFAYVSNGMGRSNPELFRNTWLQGLGWQDISIVKQVDLGSLTDLYGTQWTFLATEFDATVGGRKLHARMTVGVGNTLYDAYGAMVSMVDATAEHYKQLVGALSAVERTITLVKGQPGSRNPTTSDDTGYWSRQAANDRVARQWQESTLGVVNVHSEQTGNDYQAPLDYFWQDGPSGPGYYRRRVEGDFELLTPTDP